MTEFNNAVATENREPSLASDLYRHPDDVVSNTRLTVQEKRAVLASWVSDANAVPHFPTLRQLPNGSIVKVDDILSALKALDSGRDLQPATIASPLLWRRALERRRSWVRRARQSNKRRPGNDDDPPPCPAHAVRAPRSGGGAASAVSEPVFA